MTPILLQAEPYANAISGRLADQIFSIVLLFAFGLIMMRQYMKLEAKLDKYMDEDRKKTNDVIENNTKALEHIYQTIKGLGIGVLLMFFTFSTGCKSVKKTSKTVQTTIAVANSDTRVNSNTTTTKEVEKKDSLIVIPSKSLTGTIAADELKPLYNDKGVAKPNKKILSGKGLSVDATVNPDGSLTLTANCDSITLLVSGLVREKTLYINKYDSVLALKSAVASSQIIQDSKVVKRGFGWLVFALGIGVGAACMWLVNKIGH